MGEKYMSNKVITFIAILSFFVSLAALWVALPLASPATLRDKIVAVFSEDPIPLFETAVKGGEAHRKRAEDKAQIEQIEKINKVWTNLTASHVPFSGKTDNATTIVSFFDYNCGYCRKAHDVVEQLIKQDPTIKVVYKPVALFTDPLIIRASLAAHEQGKYKEVHNTLMSQTINPTKSGVQDLAKKLGLDMPKFLADLDSDKIKQKAEENQSLYKQMNLVGTPTYIIEKTAVIPGHIELDEFKSLIQSMRDEKAKAEAADKKAA